MAAHVDKSRTPAARARTVQYRTARAVKRGATRVNPNGRAR